MEEGHETFPLITGNASLDLVNTEVVRWGTRHDLLSSREDLYQWIQMMQQSGAFTAIKLDLDYLSSEVLVALRDLRSFLRAKFEMIAKEGQGDTEWKSYLEELIERAPFAYKVIEGKLTPDPIGQSVNKLISLVAFDALRLLVSGELAKLRFCSNPDCILLFIDKSGRRKWCSMKICGNRVKVARYKSRKQNSED